MVHRHPHFFSDVDTASGDVTDGGVTPFAYSSTTTMTDALDVSSPPAATVTVESVAGNTSTGSIASPANFTETTTAGHADTVGNSIAENLGSYEVYHAVHDGANEPVLDSSKGLVSAVGGQDANAMEFVGPEVHVAQNATNTAMVIDEGWSGASPITSWVSHPSAIGYRRQGALTIGSGSGAHTLTIEAVAPEFDSGMNDGTDGQELERVANFYTGAEENPTAAQSAPTPRAGQQTSGMGAPGGSPSMGGITDPSSGKEPTWTPAFNPYSGHGNYNPFAGWSWPSFWPFDGGDDGGTGGIPNADGSGTDPDGAALTMLPGYPGTNPGSQGGLPGGGTGPPPLYPPDHEIVPGKWSNSNEPDQPASDPSTTPATPPPQDGGSQVNPAQPAPQQDASGSAIIVDPGGGASWDEGPPSMSAAPSENFVAGTWNNLTSAASEFFTRDAAREYETATDPWDRLDAAGRNTLLNKLYHHVATPIAAGAGDALGAMAQLLGDTPGTLQRLGSSAYAGANLLYNDPQAVGEAAYRAYDDFNRLTPTQQNDAYLRFASSAFTNKLAGDFLEAGLTGMPGVGSSRPIRNAHLAGQNHPVTGVPFDSQGFPDFSGVATRTVTITQTGNRAGDFVAANAAAGLAETPSGFTWHHHQDGTTMQLVPLGIHKATGHTGGFALNPVVPGG